MYLNGKISGKRPNRQHCLASVNSCQKLQTKITLRYRTKRAAGQGLL